MSYPPSKKWVAKETLKVGGMTDAAKEDAAAAPLAAGALGAAAVVGRAQGMTKLAQQLRPGGARGPVLAGPVCQRMSPS